LHQPAGLIVPSTSLQAAGETKNEQSMQRWPFFGLDWYAAASWDSFAASAAAVVDAKAAASTAAPPAKRVAPRKTFRREIALARLVAAFSWKDMARYPLSLDRHEPR